MKHWMEALIRANYRFGRMRPFPFFPAHRATRQHPK